jgi:hypothetical protein
MRIIRQIVSFVLILAGLIMLAWASIPYKRQILVTTILPAEMQAPEGGQGGGQALLQARQVVLEWPESMRIGDKAVISLAFQPAENQTNDNYHGSDLTDAYASYNLMAEGGFEVAGLRVNPDNPVRESLLAGQMVSLKWTIGAQEAGSFPGDVWLSLRFLPLDGSPASDVPIFVQQVELHASSLLGLGGPQARLLGGMGVIVGLALSTDVMIRMFKKLITKGRTKIVQVTTKDTKELIDKESSGL